MNPLRSLFGRVTINGKRFDLGFANLSTLFLRAAEQYRTTRSTGADITIILEVSGAKLPDSSIMSREQILEQSLAAQTITDPDEESPFEGITIARVHEAMSSPEYQAYAPLCTPDGRAGIPIADARHAQETYAAAYPDCFLHFPRWIES